MKTLTRSLTAKLFAAAFVFLFLGIFCSTVSAQNIISGTIYDPTRSPLADIDVELLDEYYRVVRNGRQKTSSSGRYEFTGLNNGRYYIRVFAFRYDLKDELREVVISSVSAIPGGVGASFNLEDFYLQPRRGGLRDAEFSAVFAQDVPDEAEKAYKKAVEDLSKKRADEGFAGLQRSIELFPNYFLALQRFGGELFARKQYLAAAQAYLRAAEVNPKSSMSFYNAGLSFYLLGDKYYKSGLTVLGEAAKLAPASSAVHLLIGTMQRKQGDLVAAEATLLKAKKMATTKTPEIHKELAQLYENQKKYKEAADEFEQYAKASKLSDEDEAKAKQVVARLRAKAQGQSQP